MKEFDIFLNKRLTECDIIVSAIPYRDGLTIINRMVLECCLEAYLLQKLIAVQTGSELTAHIDEMIKTCYERLNWGIELSAAAEFSSTSYAEPEHTIIEIGTEPVTLFAETYEKAISGLMLAVEPFRLTLKKYIGQGRSSIAQDAELRNILKRSIERFDSGVLLDAMVEGTMERNFEQASAELAIGAEMKDLLYRVYRSGETAVEIAAVVESIQLHRILGNAEAGITIDAETGDGDMAHKFLAVEPSMMLLAKVTEAMIQYMEPERMTITLFAEAGAILRRFRKVEEVDPFALGDIDNMALGELDYVVLEE